MPSVEGKALGPSLFIFGAALALLAAALLPGNIPRWGAVALLAAAYFSAPSRRLPANALSLAVLLFCAWQFLGAVYVTPNYSAESLYRPLVMLGGFAVVAALGPEALPRLFRGGAALLALLVLLGLLQHFVGFWHLSYNQFRASATFVTPNSFATAINLILLPLVALCVARRGGWPALALAAWLFAGLLATESRGGMLGFLAGCAFIAICAGWQHFRQAWPTALKLTVGALAIAGAFAATAVIINSTPEIQQQQERGAKPFGTTILSRGAANRIELASVALAHVFDAPLTGVGANMYRPLYEVERPLGNENTDIVLYAHNDYLQVWLENGIVGLALLVWVVLAALAPVFASRTTPAAGNVVLQACSAALAACFVQAVVDFPLYVPFLLFVTGAFLGGVSGCLGDRDYVGRNFGRLQDWLAGIDARIGAVAVVIGLAWLSQPLLAELAGDKALAELTAGHLEAGKYWQSLPRRLEPRNPVHYWTEAVIWRETARESGDRAAAARADVLLADGIAANPYEIANYLERARLNRQYAALLERAASPQDILAWTESALRLRPGSLVAQGEHARALAYAGRTADAQSLAREMLARRPDSTVARNVAADLL